MNEQKMREQLQHAVQTRLSGLEAQPWLAQHVLAGEGKATKGHKRLSFGLILGIVLTLALTGAVAAAIHWNVMDFLFGKENPEASFLIKNIEAQASDGQVTLNVHSVLCDGESLALDWTVCNTEPDVPVFLQIERFDANDTALWSDGNDSFDCQWLPGWCNDGTMQDGEFISLPDDVTGDVLNLEMTVGVYRPRKPVYRMDFFNELEAKKKMDEGYYVIAEEDGFVVEDQETGGLIHCYGGIPADTLDDYERTELVISCKLDLAKARSACVELASEPCYLPDGLMATYTQAKLTPVALYLTLEISGGDFEQYDALVHPGWFKLTDAQGTPLEHPCAYGESGEEMKPDGTSVWRATNITLLNTSTDELAKTISLSLLDKDQTVKCVFPIELSKKQ